MRLIFEPQGKYRATSHQPSRPPIPRPPRRNLVLHIADDDDHFGQILSQDSSRSNSELKSALTASTHQMWTKDSFLTKLFGGKTDGGDGEILSPLKDDDVTETLTNDDHHNEHDSSAAASDPLIAPVSESKRPLPNVPSEAATLSSVNYTGRAEKVMANLKLESSRSEISLLALIVLVLVVNMGYVIWIGARRRRQLAEWPRREKHDHNHPEDKDLNEKHDIENLSRLSSTAKLLRSSFLASSSGGRGLDDPGMMPPVLKKTQLAVPLSSAWPSPKAIFGLGDDKKKGDKTTSGSEKDRRLFEEMSPQPTVTCTPTTPLDLQQPSPIPFEEHGKPISGCRPGPHQHGLVPALPAVMPVSVRPASESSSSASSSTRGSISSTASDFIERARRTSNTIITDTILPPVQAQVEVLTEIGRRVSVGFQTGVGSVIARGLRDNRQTGGDDEGGYGYSLPQYHKPTVPAAGSNKFPSSTGGSGSLTPPVERYHRDLEAGRAASFQTTRPRAKTDSVIASGSERPTTQAGGGASGAMAGPPRDGAVGGLVRRTNIRPNGRHHHHPHQRKRVSFVDGFVSAPSFGSGSSTDAYGSRLSGFSFLRRGSGEACRPVDEEMAGQDGLQDGHQAMGHDEDEVWKNDRRWLQLV